ncbi:MAG: hypothetical protein KatS3mg103_1312 [Phycisphaerales bacterium]|nr:MAG: hypothetical protein KatS3mg103_1312 [Phycisphaerales bacterium]
MIRPRLSHALAVLALAQAAAHAHAQAHTQARGLYPVADVRTVCAQCQACGGADGGQGELPKAILVEVPTLDRLMPYQRFAIDPSVRQNDPQRFEIRVDGTIRNSARTTNAFVRAQRYVADRLEEARLAWLKAHGHLGGVTTHHGRDAQADRPPIQPRATIRMPEGSTGGGGFRVQAPAADRSQLVAALQRLHAHRRSVVRQGQAPAVARAD